MAAGGESIPRLYTRTGDDGSTALVGAVRVAKDSARIEAYGILDELAGWIALVRADLPEALRAWDPLLTRLQHEAFLAESEIATPPGRDPPAGRIGARHVARLEADIDAHSGPASGLRTFVLPGGSPTAARLHIARTVARRAERAIVRLHRAEPLPDDLRRWINRLSDLLFALALEANAALGVPETPVDYTA
ncbi:MAG: cob(I)yrinic acid a,c-diamide adenosyltransferase [Thermoplasmata archaeon]